MYNPEFIAPKRAPLIYKLTLYTLISALFLGCSASKQNMQTPDDKSAQIRQYKSQTGYHYALIQKEKDSWKLISLSDVPIEKIEKLNQDILQVSETTGEVVPYFEKGTHLNPLNRYECSRVPDSYSPCSSTLLSDFGDKKILNFYKSNQGANYKYIDEERIDKAVRDTNLFSVIEAKIPLFERNQYVRSFNAATTAEEYNNFIMKYSYMQNELNLLTLARERRDEIYNQEQDEKIKAAKERERESELKLQDEQRRYITQEQMAKKTAAAEVKEENSKISHQSKLQNFRKNLKAGEETNCGKIIEIKNSSAKVYFPLKDYADEHWIDINKLFPKDHGCRFIKGKYMPPPSF